MTDTHATEWGTVQTDDGQTVHVLQSPYISSGTMDRAHYEAMGRTVQQIESGDSDYYMIVWEIICPDTDDESNACDWDNPVSVELK